MGNMLRVLGAREPRGTAGLLGRTPERKINSSRSWRTVPIQEGKEVCIPTE